MKKFFKKKIIITNLNQNQNLKIELISFLIMTKQIFQPKILIFSNIVIKFEFFFFSF